jgi:hypothetical protein
LQFSGKFIAMTGDLNQEKYMKKITVAENSERA